MPNDYGPSPLIILEEVSKLYWQGEQLVRAVEQITLEIEPGDFLVITGRSAAGKTTLLSLIGGLTTPTSGSVWVDGGNLAWLDDAGVSALRANRIGFVFQFASLIPTLTVLDNVRLPGLFAEHPQESDYAVELLRRVGLGDRLGSYPAQLSGGQQRRVAVARALVNRPVILLADEPTGDLDVETEQEIMTLFGILNAQEGMTVALVTHNPELAGYGNRHLQMMCGRLIETTVACTSKVLEPPHVWS